MDNKAANLLMLCGGEPGDPLYNPLGHISFVSDNTFNFSMTNASIKNLEYSTDLGSTWNTLTSSTSISAVYTDSVYHVLVRGSSNTALGEWYASDSCVISLTASAACYGNLETLLDYSTALAGSHPIMGYYAFANLFYNCSNLTSVSTNCLPATTLIGDCYLDMFCECTSLTTAPALPATTSTGWCYFEMFKGCTSLTSIPALPATTLTDGCYQFMFYSCTSLKFSTSRTSECPNAYRIPKSGTGVDRSMDSRQDMFYGTSGTFTGEPSINTTYYTNATVVS